MKATTPAMITARIEVPHEPISGEQLQAPGQQGTHRVKGKRRHSLLIAAAAIVACGAYYMEPGSRKQSQPAQWKPAAAASGTVPTVASPSASRANFLPTSRSSLVTPANNHSLLLIGVVFGRQSLALVSVDHGPAQTYAVGDSLAKNVVLYRVDPRQAVVWHDGALETLPLRSTLTTKDVAVPVAGVAPRAGAPVVPAAMRSAIHAEGKNAYSLDRDYVLRYVRSNKFLSDGKIISLSDGSFRIVDLNPVGLFSQLGLNVGDVLRDVDVNGQSVNAAGDVASIFQKMGDAQQLRLQILRNGHAQDLNYYFR